jgi:hypothetical protein
MNKDALIPKLEQVKNLAEECIDQLQRGAEKQRSRKVAHEDKPREAVSLDFSKDVRPFMKSYGKNLSGPRAFVLLLAWLTKGDCERQVELSEIEQEWNRLTALLRSDFNRKFSLVARENDWVEAKKQGLYNLRSSWRDALKNKG